MFAHNQPGKGDAGTAYKLKSDSSEQEAELGQSLMSTIALFFLTLLSFAAAKTCKKCFDYDCL